MAQHPRTTGARFAVGLFVCLLALASATPVWATVFTVTKTADTADGTCDADCSLREAIIAANANPDVDTIQFQTAGLTYTITRGPADAPFALVAATGDFDITNPLTINGNNSFVNGGALDRVLHIEGTFAVTINNLRITNGLATGFLSYGGGLYIRSAAVTINNSVFAVNLTEIEGGTRDHGGAIAVVGTYDAPTGIATRASLTLNGSTFGNNFGGSGGAIVCIVCNLNVSNTQIEASQALNGDGGGIAMFGNSSSLSLTGGSLGSNSALARGGGLAVPFGTSTSTLTRTRIAENRLVLGGASAVYNNVGVVTATNNWWGCNFGPGATGSGCSQASNPVVGAVTTSPFLVLRTTASPTSIPTGATSTVTADLRFNSSNADTSAGGTPGGLGAAFTGTLGTLIPGSATLVNGTAISTYVAGNSTGAASVQARVDRQTIGTGITIVPVAPSFTGNPANQSVPEGATTFFSVTAGGSPSPTLQWQFSLNGGGSWTNLTNNAQYSGVTTGHLIVTNVSAAMQGYRYRALATNATASVSSSVATLTVQVSTIDDRLALGLGSHPSDGGWALMRRGSGSSFAASASIRLPWDGYNATGGGLRPAAGDIDGDGLDEIVVGLDRGGAGWLAVFDDAAHGYALLKWIQVPWAAYNTANGEVWPAVGDLDGNGAAEIVAGLGQGGAGWFVIFGDATSNFALRAWRQVTRANYHTTGSGATHPAVGNFDGAGGSEIVIGLGTGGAGNLEVYSDAAGNYAHRASMQVNWGGYNTANGTTFPAAGDLDGDGRAEIIVGLGIGGAGWLYRFDDAASGYAGAGWLRTSWAAFNGGGNGETHPAIGNLDGDALPELVIGLGPNPGGGGWFEIVDDSAALFASLGWKSIGREPFRLAGGSLFPAIGRFK